MSTRLSRQYLGEDVPLVARYEDPETGDPVDPDDTDATAGPDATVTITGPDGTEVVTGAAMTSNAIGELEYVWDTSVDATGTGTYTAEASADFSGETKILRMSVSLR